MGIIKKITTDAEAAYAATMAADKATRDAHIPRLRRPRPRPSKRPRAALPPPAQRAPTTETKPFGPG